MTSIASILLIIGLVLIRCRIRWGWLLQVVGSTFMIYHFWGLDTSIVVLNFIFGGVALEAFFKWRKQEYVRL